MFEGKEPHSVILLRVSGEYADNDFRVICYYTNVICMGTPLDDNVFDFNLLPGVVI